MVQHIVLDNKIIVWWKDKIDDKFSCYLNGELACQTEKTFVEFNTLTPDTQYNILVKTEQGVVVVEESLTTAKTKKKLDVTKPPYNAVGDGVTLNTVAIQKALDDCDENSCVYVPNGTFLTGALDVHDNTELYIEKDGVIKGSERTKDYAPKVFHRFEGIEMWCYRSLINVSSMDHDKINCKNVTIRGGGKILGGGKPLMEDVVNTEREEAIATNNEVSAELLKTFERSDTQYARVRPKLIAVNSTENVNILDVSIEYGCAWNLHILYSKQVNVYNCHVESFGVWNGDGIDPESSVDVAIFGCEFNTGDDCIAIKAGKNPQGNIINRKCANVYIFENTFIKGHGMSLGSEMSGGLENIYIWHCNTTGTINGIHIKATRKRGGYVRNVYVESCKLNLIIIRGVPYNDDGEAAPTLPDFSNYYIKNSVITGRLWGFSNDTIAYRHVVIKGFGEDAKVKNVFFDNVKFENVNDEANSIYLEDCENVKIN